MAKVKDEFDIDVDEVYEKSMDNDYWKSVEDFYEDIKDKDVTELTGKQTRWLEKISADLEG